VSEGCTFLPGGIIDPPSNPKTRPLGRVTKSAKGDKYVSADPAGERVMMMVSDDAEVLVGVGFEPLAAMELATSLMLAAGEAARMQAKNARIDAQLAADSLKEFNPGLTG